MKFYNPNSKLGKEMEIFFNDDLAPPIDEEFMQQLLENPPKLCKDFGTPCSEYDETEGRCKCIRTVFKHNKHYQHYLSLVKAKVERSFVELISKKR